MSATDGAPADWREWYAYEATEGQPFDLVIDVRPASARARTPYPVPCVEIFADELLEPEGIQQLEVVYPPEGLEVCVVCWSGLRALRVTHCLRAHGWRAWWWAMSQAARVARMEA